MTAGYLGQPYWTGAGAGLRHQDRIVSAHGRVVKTGKDVQEILRGIPIGTPVQYVFDRAGERFTVTIASMRFTTADFLITAGIFFLLGVLYLFLGGAVFLMKPDITLSWLFFLGCLLESIASFIVFDLESAHYGFRPLMILCDVFLPPLVIHVSFLFPERWSWVEKHPFVVAIPYIVSAALLIPLEILYPSPAYYVIYPYALYYLVLCTLVFMGSSLFAFARRASVLARQRAKIVLAGAVLAFPIPTIAPVLAVQGGMLGGVKVLTNLAAIPMIVFPASIAYAIARHNLFDVDVFIKRTVGYAIMTAIVGAVYFGLQVGLESLVLTPVFGDAAHRITPVLFAFLVVFLFNPLNRRVQDAVDRMFYRKKFDYKATVTAVSEALSSVLNLDEIVRKIVGTVHSEMFIDRSGLILAGAQGGGHPGYLAYDQSDETAEEIRSSVIPADDPLVGFLKKQKKLVTKYDVAEDPHFADVRETCGKRFEELGASLAVPLVYQGEVKGVLAVGNKKSGHFFTREDVDLLQTLASHGAVAIENAHMAEQMKKEETVRTNLSRYLSPQIVDRIVHDDVQINLGGDRKVVTVLFSDIRNFTTITENRPPDQLVKILNEYFTEMAAVIFENQGSLDKYIGDAIVAVFGSLIPLDNPARNAVSAAVAMMKRLPELNRRWETRYGFYMNIGIGVNTGEVFLGNIGSSERMEFTVIGDAVNVASRFSGLAKAGQVLVTKETLGHLGTDIRVREHRPAEVKGKSGKLEVFEILYTQSVV